MINSRTVQPEDVLGDCVSCGGKALAFTGATIPSAGKYLCARCTAALKVAAKEKKSASGRKSRVLRRDYPEPPAVDAARWIQLGDNRFALVDAADFDRVNAKIWFLFSGYAVRRERSSGKLVHGYLHRFVLGLDADLDDKDPSIVEFIDKDFLNCRRSNLHLAPKSA
jgi:hypothetical protein